MGKRRTQEDVIKEFREVHNDFYNYDKFNYIESSIKSTVTCPTHGDFDIAQVFHRKGVGCQKCYDDRRSRHRTLDLHHFIEKSNKIHNSLYDYSATEYDPDLNQYQKVSIRCSRHGVFKQAASCHMSGKGCQKCGRESIEKSRRKGIEVWKREFSVIHDNKYSYELWAEDCKAKEKFEVICQEHGIFKSDKINHTAGKGCPTCAKTGFSPHKPAYIYVLHSESSNLSKIGISRNPPNKRNTKVKKSSGYDFHLYHFVFHSSGKLILDVEQKLLRYLRQHYGQPTDSFEGSTECFYDLDPSYLKHLIEQRIREMSPTNEQHSSTQLLETA